MEQIRYETRPAEFADAIRTARAARMVFWLILAAALGAQIAGFLLVEFGGVLDTDRSAGATPGAAPRAEDRSAAPAPEPTAAAAPTMPPAAEKTSAAERSPKAPPPAVPDKTGKTPPGPDDGRKRPTPPSTPERPAGADRTDRTSKSPGARPGETSAIPPSARREGLPPAATHPAAAAAGTRLSPKPAEVRLTPAQKWRMALGWILPTARFAAVAAGGLMVLTIFFALQLSLVGRLGGAAGLISAFFWALILLTMIVPWQQFLANTPIACGALFDLEELVAARADAAAGVWQDRALYLTRFLVYPVVAVLVWLVVHVRFNSGCFRMHFPHAVPAAGLRPGLAPAPGPGPVAAAPVPAMVSAPAGPAAVTAPAAAAPSAMPPSAGTAPPSAPQPAGEPRTGTREAGVTSALRSLAGRLTRPKQKG